MTWDVMVVGAGAAGLMAAITCRREGLTVLLLDGKEKIGAKILMSGGTRCNVTNERVTADDFESETGRTVRHVLGAFPSERAVEFFETLGVKVVLEPGGKYFPSTHSGKTILNALLKEVEKTGVELKAPCKVTRLRFEDGLFFAEGEGFSFPAKTAVISTGGLSYPATGSDGAGYKIAKSFGHRLVETSPALTPLETDDADWKSLTGVSLPVRLTLGDGPKKKAVYEGSFLFTHFGFSGPAVLNISRHWIRAPHRDSLKLAANFLPGEKEESLRADLTQSIQKHAGRLLKYFLSERLPERFVGVFLKKLSIPDSLILNQLKREDRERIIRFLFHFPLRVTGALGYQKAEVTAGGVDLGEADPKTLESKLQQGLFFAGEILDVDGRIGGFNFQWAWSSAAAAGRGVVKRLRPILRG